MQVKLVNILTYVPLSSYENIVIIPYSNSIRHEVQYKRPTGASLATNGSRFTGLLFTC